MKAYCQARKTVQISFNGLICNSLLNHETIAMRASLLIPTLPQAVQMLEGVPTQETLLKPAQ